VEQVRKSFQTLWNNWILVVPIFLTRVIPALLSIYIFSEMSGELINMLSVEEIGETQYVLENYGAVAREFFQVNRGYIMASIFVGVLGLILNFIAVPATFGMIKKQLVSKEKTGFSDVFPAAGKYFVKYFLYRISKLALWIFVFLISMILLIAGAFLGSLVDEGMALLIVLLLAFVILIGGTVLHLILKLWFPAMILGGVGVLDGLKEAFRKSRVCFWPLLAGVLTVRIIAWISNMFVDMLLGDIAYLGTLLINIIPSIATVTLLVFYLRLYLETAKDLVNSEESG
jgi:hypothetical protein